LALAIAAHATATPKQWQEPNPPHLTVDTYQLQNKNYYQKFYK
jgi:hypothetical protein